MFYNIVKSLAKVILSPFYRIRVYGMENVPSEGRIIVCANHHSNWDPIFISIAFPRQICWMGKKELFKNKLFAKVLRKLNVFPVDRQGSDLGAIKNALRLLREDKILGIFPEGTRVKSMDLNNAKSGVALLSIKSKADVLPMYIDSNYKIFNRVDIYIGQPMDLKEHIEGKPSSEDYLELSKMILRRIYNLKDAGGN